jgi:uncharacterized protein YbjQ (UPF0145 family)
MDNENSGKLMVVTTNYVPGYRITKVIGATFGVVVRSRGIGGNILASLKSIVGGEIGAYTKMLSDAREHAMQRLEENAKAQGANAVVSMSFDSSEIAQAMNEIVAYGTAVVVEEDPKAADAVSLR